MWRSLLEQVISQDLSCERRRLCLGQWIPFSFMITVKAEDLLPLEKAGGPLMLLQFHPCYLCIPSLIATPMREPLLAQGILVLRYRDLTHVHEL